MCARVTSTYMEFTFTFGPKPEFKFSFNLIILTLSYRLILLYHGFCRRTSVFIFTIHLPPVEEGEFLLYIMLKFYRSFL